MTSLEFIEKHIKETQSSIKAFELDYELFHRVGDKRDAEKLTQILIHLQQIKAKLETLEVIKEELQIVDKTTNLYGEPLYRYELNVVGQDKINTLEKGLEEQLELIKSIR